MMKEDYLNSLPLGFRFRPTDEELVNFYLRLKINGKNDAVKIIREIDVCRYEPVDLPDLSVLKSEDNEWFFFCPIDRKYPSGSRMNRATGSGYWKSTGRDRNVKSGSKLIGTKKTLVFYHGRAPTGTRTNWVMHEYRATEENLSGTNPGQSAYVLYKLMKKQDERVKDLGSDEIELTGSSLTPTKSSSGDIKSEVEQPETTPVLEMQHDEALDLGFEETPVDLSMFYDLSELLDDQTFPPLPLGMQNEQSMFSPVNYGGAWMPENNEDDLNAYLSDFLDSVLVEPDEYYDGKFSGAENYSTSGSEGAMLVYDNKTRVNIIDGQLKTEFSDSLCYQPSIEAPLLMETTQQQNPHSSNYSRSEINNISRTLQNVVNDKSHETGIRVRTRQPQKQPAIEQYVLQGHAPRRLLLQTTPQVLSRKSEYLEKYSNEEVGKLKADKMLRIEKPNIYQNLRNVVLKNKNIAFMLQGPRSGGQTKWSYGLVLRVAVLAVIFLTSVCTWQFISV